MRFPSAAMGGECRDSPEDQWPRQPRPSAISLVTSHASPHDSSPSAAIMPRRSVSSPRRRASPSRPCTTISAAKEGLAQAVLTVPLARLVDSLRVLLDEPADPSRRLVAMAGAYLEFSREDPDRARFVHGLFFGPKGS